MRVVAALGGNALLERGERPDPRTEHLRARAAARALAPLARAHELVVCHGNGPQIGLLAAESENDPQLATPYPLDVIGAQTQGMIGYCLAQELRSADIGRDVVAVVTQTLVDSDDPAFTDPTKFIGPQLSRTQADDLVRERGWTVKADGDAWRRVVASPQPLAVVELDIIRILLEHGRAVICGGGGGVPVHEVDGVVTGALAVVDKDATAALLGIDLAADLLIILTDVDAVKADYGLPTERSLREVAVEELAQMPFAAGSMGPKVAACLEFVTRTGRPARIGSLRQAEAVLAGTSGTQINPKHNASATDRTFGSAITPTTRTELGDSHGDSDGVAAVSLTCRSRSPGHPDIHR